MDQKDAFSQHLEKEKEIRRGRWILNEITIWEVSLNLIVLVHKAIVNKKKHWR